MRKAILFALVIILAIFSASSYQTKSHKWPEDDPFVVVEIQDDIPDSWITPITEAGNSWNNVNADFTYTFTPNNNDNYMNIGSVDGSGSGIAKTDVSVWGDLEPSTIESGHITFDETEDFSTVNSTTEYRVEAIAAHELGHLLGLAHTNVDPSGCLDDPTMISSAPPNCDDFLRSLEPDDKNGIKSLY